MQTNIGLVDRYLRLVAGMVILGGAAQLNRRRAMVARSALMSLGAMKIAEGITGWCPLTHLTKVWARHAEG